jgi:CRP-like cAMP-binding protein
MPNDSSRVIPAPPATPRSAALRRVMRQLPLGGPEQQAIAAGEIDAVIDHGNANVFVFPAARRALRGAARLASSASRQAVPHVPAANSLLAALPHTEYLRLLPGLEPVMLEFGDVLHEPGAPIRYVYFPVDCVVCLMARTGDQRAAEVGLVGHEGMVGLALALGVDVSSVRTVVQTRGKALRMQAARFGDDFLQCRALQRELYRYAYVKLAQARQTAACFAAHLLPQRLACWLLMSSDRARSQEVRLTQEYLATLFCVRRVSVTSASTSLRDRHLISYSRGRIRILNRKGLEAASCSCYSRIEFLHAEHRA